MVMPETMMVPVPIIINAHCFWIFFIKPCRACTLFPAVGGFLHGGDYNPEQWLDRPDILEEDIRMMKKAGSQRTPQVYGLFLILFHGIQVNSYSGYA